jgi:hypothetical protein
MNTAKYMAKKDNSFLNDISTAVESSSIGERIAVINDLSTIIPHQLRLQL